jgi:site-specific recombinase XerD
MPTPRALSAQAVQQLKQTMLAWVSATRGEASQWVWPHRDRAMVMLMLHAGVTIDELCALNLDDVIADERGRHLRAGLAQRSIPLCLEARQTLSRWQAMRGLAFGQRDCSALFVTRSMKRINRTMVRGLLARLQRESGVPFDSFALRHTFVREMVQQGLPPDDISGMLGRPSHEVIAMYARG